MTEGSWGPEVNGVGKILEARSQERQIEAVDRVISGLVTDIPNTPEDTHRKIALLERFQTLAAAQGVNVVKPPELLALTPEMLSDTTLYLGLHGRTIQHARKAVEHFAKMHNDVPMDIDLLLEFLDQQDRKRHTELMRLEQGGDWPRTPWTTAEKEGLSREAYEALGLRPINEENVKVRVEDGLRKSEFTFDGRTSLRLTQVAEDDPPAVVYIKDRAAGSRPYFYIDGKGALFDGLSADHYCLGVETHGADIRNISTWGIPIIINGGLVEKAPPHVTVNNGTVLKAISDVPSEVITVKEADVVTVNVRNGGEFLGTDATIGEINNSDIGTVRVDDGEIGTIKAEGGSITKVRGTVQTVNAQGEGTEVAIHGTCQVQNISDPARCNVYNR